jgi:hypothetical protein
MLPCGLAVQKPIRHVACAFLFLFLCSEVQRADQKPKTKGPPKNQKKNGDPCGGWVGLRQKKDQGPIYFFDIFCGVFELPSPRNAQKRDKQNREKVVLGFLVDFFVKTFRHDFLQKIFIVFLNFHR